MLKCIQRERMQEIKKAILCEIGVEGRRDIFILLFIIKADCF